MCFTELVRRHFGPQRYRWGALWFALGTASLMFTNRIPFAMGVAFGMAACLALQRDRRLLAPVLAVLAAISSPVAGLFVTLAGTAYALTARGEGVPLKRLDGALLAAGGLIPPVLLTLAFPEGGYAPFPFTSYVTIPICVRGGAAGAAPERAGAARGRRAVRARARRWRSSCPPPWAATPPAWACWWPGRCWPARWRAGCAGRSRPIVVLLLALLVWQLSPAARDVYKAATDPVAKASYFDPVREYLRLLPDQRRVEIPFTLGHWEGAEVGSDFPMARGWLRQLDTGRNPIFYKGNMSQLAYANWLSENAVRYVALPDAKPDNSAYREVALIERGLPYLRLRASFEHWRIYEVTLPTPVVIPRGGADIELEQLGSDQVLLRVRKPGSALVRVRWTPYWLAKGGCVERDGDWTRVTATKPGFLKLVTRFGPERVLQRGKRCNTG